MENLILYATSDPEVAIAEFDDTGVAPDGTPFRAPNIQVFRVRDGVIVETHDYRHQIALMRAYGGLDALLDEVRQAS